MLRTSMSSSSNSKPAPYMEHGQEAAKSLQVGMAGYGITHKTDWKYTWIFPMKAIWHLRDIYWVKIHVFYFGQSLKLELHKDFFKFPQPATPFLEMKMDSSTQPGIL